MPTSRIGSKKGCSSAFFTSILFSSSYSYGSTVFLFLLPASDSANRTARSECTGSTDSSRSSSPHTFPAAPEHAHTECDPESAAAAFPEPRRQRRSGRLASVPHSDCPDRRVATCSVEDSTKSTFPETTDADSDSSARSLEASGAARPQCSQRTKYRHSSCSPQ